MENMEAKIKQILEDLYAIDSGLRSHEETLVKLIRELLAAQPDTKFDAKVAGELRRKVMTRASLLQSSQSKINLKNFLFMRKLNFVLGGVAALAIVAAVGSYYQFSKTGTVTLPGQMKNNTQVFSDKQEIKPVDDNAFGNLALATFTAGGMGGGGGGSAASGSAAPQAADQYTAKIAPAPVGMGGGSAEIMPPLISYKFVYKGEDFSIDGDQVQVYRRVKGLPSGIAPDQLLTSLNFGLLDVGKFGNTTVQSMNLVQNQDWGYSFYINFDEGTISLSENWLKWPTPDKSCRDQQCFDSLRLKLSDVPADSEVLAIADQFVKEHNIPVGSYGSPYVQNQWRKEYERTQDKSQFYVPDVLTVVYPLQIDGKQVYDESGNATGLSLSVNVRARKVSGLYELSNQQYESSSYAAETSAKRLTEVAEKGGFRNVIYYTMPAEVPGQKTVTQTVELGTPTKAMVKLWMPKDNQPMQELYVPALVFPVTKAPTGGYYADNVVVPLAKEILDSQQNPSMGIMK